MDKAELGQKIGESSLSDDSLGISSDGQWKREVLSFLYELIYACIYI